jgi:hypothetical protein
VKKDDYYKVKGIKVAMAACFDEDQKWLTSRWIGSALRRLGFKDKRRVGTGYEYRLATKEVRNLALRMGLLEAQEGKHATLAVKRDHILETISKMGEGDKGASITSVLDALQDRIPRIEVSQIISNIIEKERVLAMVGMDRVRRVF